MPEKAKVHGSLTAMTPKGHMALKSSALCTTDCSFVSQLLVQERMAAHYRKLGKAKAAVDTSPPKTWSGSQKVRDQVRREAVKQGGKGVMLLKKSNSTKLHSPLNTSRTSSDAAREEMMAMLESLNDEDFPDGVVPRATLKHKDDSTLEVNPPGSSVNLSLDDVNNMHTMAHNSSSQKAMLQRAKSVEPATFNRSARPNSVRYPVVYHSLDETSRGNVTRRAGGSTVQVTRSGDLLDSHNEKFTERKPFTPKTLKTNSKSKLVEFKYYNRPPAKKEVGNDFEDNMNHTNIPKSALGRTMHYPRNKPIPKMTTESDLMNETLQSRADHEVTPTGVPPLNISLDPDHINWLQEQSRKSSSRRGYESHVDKTSDVGTTHRSRNRPPAGLSTYKTKDMKTTLAGTNTMTLDKVQESGEDDLKYLEFVSEVTNDVLDRGIFTNRALHQIFETHVKRNKGKLETKRMYDLLEDLRIDLGIPPGNENIDNTFGDTFDYGNDKSAEPREREFEYSRDTLPSTVTHVTPLGQNPLLNNYREDDLHAFEPIISTSDVGGQRDNTKSNTPVFSETRTPSRKGSYHSERHETENSRKSSFHSDIHQKTANLEDAQKHNESFDDHTSEVLSDVTAVSSRSSLGKTTMKSDNNTHRPNSYDEEDGYDDVDTARKSHFDHQDENKKPDGVKEDDYDTKYEDDEYEVETGRTDNENNDLSTLRTNCEEIEEESVGDRSETDVYGQTEIESTTIMKTDTKSNDDVQS